MRTTKPSSIFSGENHKAVRVLVWTAFAVFLAKLALTPVLAEDAPLTIRLSTHNRMDAPNSVSLKLFKDRVEEASSGRIVIDIRHSAELYGAGQIGGALTSGAVEMGYASLSRYASDIPIADAFQLPFLFNTGELDRTAILPGSEIRALIERAVLEKAGTRILWWVPAGQSVFLTNGFSAAHPGNIAGKTVRTLGPATEALVRQCGGQPRNIDGQEMEKAYENREVDVGQAGISTFAGRKLWRFMDTVTRTNHTSVQYVVAVNEKYWRSLSDAQRAILAEAAAAADTEARENNARIEANAYRDAEARGIKVVSPNYDELNGWRICSSDILEWFLQRAGAEGWEFMQAYGRMRKEREVFSPAGAKRTHAASR